MNDEIKNNIRTTVAKIMDRTDWKTPDDKNTQLIKKTIAQIKKNKEIMVCKADKGNMTVIMNTKEYTTINQSEQHDQFLSLQETRSESKL